MRRTVGSRPECGTAAARRRSGQVSADGKLSRGARGPRGRGSAAPDAVRPAGQAPRSGGRPRPSSRGLSGCGLRGQAGLLPERTCERLQLLSATGTGAGGRCRARPGRGLGAALGCGRGPERARGAGTACGGLQPWFPSSGGGRTRLGAEAPLSAALCCPPGARPPRLVLHCPLAKAGVENRSCFFPRAAGRGPHATSALRERSIQCSWSLPFRVSTLPSRGCSLGLRLCLFSLVATLGEGAD